MNINTLVVKVSTDGITKASRELDNLGKAADNTEKKIKSLVDSVEKMVKQFAMSVSGTKALTDALAVVNRSTAASDAAMKSLSSSVMKLSTEVAQLSARMNQGNSSVVNNTTYIRQNATAMTDAHAAARGLTGSLGALWLTYGNVAPLAAGAAIGASLKAIVTIGVDVEHTLENIRIKGENSIEAMRDVAKAVADMGNGVYGPQEIVKALETLSLAGLKAKDAVNAIGAAMNLAIVGGTDINQAAEALVTIGTAVGATSKEYDYLADGIAKAANISLASVESISEAVKRASVVNKLYGASFEDILTQTAALAQLGIKNTAAGTAITNFYANARAETDKAKAAVDALGFSFQDASGKVKPIVQALTEYQAALDKFDTNSQKNLITAQFGERALRDVQALLSLLNQAAESTERLSDGTLKYKNRLEEVQAQIADSAGTSALQAAQQALTTENQLKSVANTLKSSFGEAFKAVEPDVQRIARSLREVFGSQEFKTAVENLARGFANLAITIADNIGPLTAIIEGFVAVAAITAGGSLFSRLIPILSGVAVAMGSVTVATNGATIATGALGLAIKALPGIGMILGAAATAYALYTLHTDKATESTAKLAEEKAKIAGNYNGDFLKALEDEVNRLDKVNAKLKEGVTLQQAELATTKQLALEKQKSYNQDSVTAAEKAVADAKKNQMRNIGDYINQPRYLKEVKDAQEKLNAAKKTQIDFDTKAANLAQDIINKTKQQQDQLKKNTEDAENRLKNAAGTKTFEGKDNSAKKELTFLENERLSLEKVTAQYNARTTAVLTSYEIGSKVMAESYASTVEVNKLEGKYSSEKAYRDQLALANAADEAKFNNEKAKSYVELGQKMKDILQGEKAYQEAAKEGQTTQYGNLRRQVEAMIPFLKLTQDQSKAFRELADDADAVNKTQDARLKLQSLIDRTRSDAAKAKEEADLMALYGTNVKSSAIAVAQYIIEKQKLNGVSDEALEKTLLEVSGLKQLNTALSSLQRSNNDLETQIEKAQADGVLIFAEREEQKIKIKADSLKRQAQLDLDRAREGFENSADNPEAWESYVSAYEAYRKKIENIDELSRIKINNANLWDWKKTVDKIVDVGLDGFEDIFEGGKSIWKSLTNSIKDMFKKTVIDYIKKEFAKPFLLNVVANVSGSMGMSGIANTASAMGGGNKDGSPLSLVSAASNIYKAISGGFAALSTGVADAVQVGLHATGLSPNLLTNGSFATSVGSLAASAAGIAAGYAVNKAISGKYEVSKGVSAIGNIATAVAGYINPVLGVVAGAIAGLVNRAFGRGPKETQSQGIRGTLGDMGASGESYLNWKQDGGWFRSDKTGTDVSGLSSDVTNTLASGFTALKVATSGLASTLGISSTALDGFSKSFDIAFGTDAQKNQEAVTKFFTDLGDELATKLIPNISEFARQGETASQTLERLSNVFEATNQIANVLGKSAEQVWGSLGLSSDKARERIVDLAGGIDKLTSKTVAYASAFLTDAEKLAPVQKAVSEAMKSLGYESITTKDQFKALVNSLDLTNEAQAKLFNNLLDLAPAFAEVADATQKAIDALKEANEKMLELAQGALESAFDNVTKSIEKRKDDLRSAYDLEVENIRKLGDERKEAAQKNLDLAKESLAAISKVFDSLSDVLKSTQVESDAINKARRISAQNYLRSIVGTDLTKATGLNSALADISKPSSEFFSTFEEYAFDQAKSANLIDGLKNTADIQKTFAELTVDRLDATIKAIEEQTEIQLDAAKAKFDIEMEKLDAQLALAQSQLDVALGIQNAILTIPQALAQFTSALAAFGATKGAVSAPIVPGNGGAAQPMAIQSGIESLYQNLLGRQADSSGLAFWMDSYNKGESFQNIADNIMKSAEYQQLHPSFDIGTNFVPKDMLANIHAGERIIPAADNAELMRRLDADEQSSKNSEVSSLAKEIADLRQVIMSGDIAKVQYLRELTQIERKWDQEGLPETRDVEA